MSKVKNAVRILEELLHAENITEREFVEMKDALDMKAAEYVRMIERSGLIDPASLISGCCHSIAKHSKSRNYVCTFCNRACHLVNLGAAYGGNMNPPDWRRRGKDEPQDVCKGCRHLYGTCLHNEHCMTLDPRFRASCKHCGSTVDDSKCHENASGVHERA